MLLLSLPCSLIWYHDRWIRMAFCHLRHSLSSPGLIIEGDMCLKKKLNICTVNAKHFIPCSPLYPGSSLSPALLSSQACALPWVLSYPSTWPSSLPLKPLLWSLPSLCFYLSSDSAVVKVYLLHVKHFCVQNCLTFFHDPAQFWAKMYISSLT